MLFHIKKTILAGIILSVLTAALSSCTISETSDTTDTVHVSTYRFKPFDIETGHYADIMASFYKDNVLYYALLDQTEVYEADSNLVNEKNYAR